MFAHMPVRPCLAHLRNAQLHVVRSCICVCVCVAWVQGVGGAGCKGHPAFGAGCCGNEHRCGGLVQLRFDGMWGGARDEGTIADCRWPIESHMRLAYKHAEGAGEGLQESCGR